VDGSAYVELRSGWECAALVVGDITGMGKRVNSVDFKPGRPYRIAAGSEDFSVSFFQGPPFKFMHTAHKHANFVNCVRFSPDGERFASVGSDGKGKIYDGRSGAVVGDVPGGKMGEGGGHAGTVYAASWSPCGWGLPDVLPFHQTSTRACCHSTQYQRECAAIPPNVHESVLPFHPTSTTVCCHSTQHPVVDTYFGTSFLVTWHPMTWR